MDIDILNQQLKTCSIFDIPLRVTYYARVSSESDEQLNSLGNQIAYFEDYIKSRPSWTFVPGYIDEGLSGMSTKKRENFNQMVEDGKAGKFDLIITKEISRFARNTVDTLSNTQELRKHGVGVYFQNDDLKTYDEDGKLRLTIMASVAEDELRKLSSRVKFGHKQAIKNHVVLGNSRIIGYQKAEGRLVIDETQAPMVQELFQLYATGEYSMKQLEKIFFEKGYRNLNGNKIAHSTMSGIIANPKYKGWYAGGKVIVVDMVTKKQKFIPPEQWTMFKDESGELVPAIVSEELWEQANEVLRRRSEDVKNRQGICNHANLLTGKLFCASCGTPYYRKDAGNGNSKWVCSGKINNGKDSCNSFPIYESELIPLLFEVFRDTKDVSNAMVDEYLKMFRSLTADGELPKRINAQETVIAKAQKKKKKLLELVTEDSISNADFKAMTAQCNEEIKNAEAELAELHQQESSRAEFQSHMDRIRSTLKAAEQDVASGVVTKDFIDTFIDRIFATPEEDGTMRLDIRIFTGETTQKYLERLKRRTNPEGRTGHTFKKMIEAYEQGIQ